MTKDAIIVHQLVYCYCTICIPISANGPHHTNKEGEQMILWPGWPDWANFRLLSDCLLWAVLLENYRSSSNFWTTLSHCISSDFFDKIWAGNILGDFFTSSSGHPVCDPTHIMSKLTWILSINSSNIWASNIPMYSYKNAQIKRSPKGQKFAQSGHPATITIERCYVGGTLRTMLASSYLSI
jgi:hypothetical protein